MSSELERQAAKIAIELTGQVGNKGIFAVDVDKITTSTNMINGAYTIAAQPVAPVQLSVTVTAVGTADTMGKITFVGTDVNGNALTEEVIPVADDTVYTVNDFASVTSATGSGWAIDEVEGTNDTVTIGVASALAGDGFYFSAIQVLADTVVASQTNVTGAITAELSDFTKLPVGTYPCKCTAIALTSGEAIGIMSRG